MKLSSKILFALGLFVVVGNLFFYNSTKQQSTIITPAELPKLIYDRSAQMKKKPFSNDTNDQNQLISYFAEKHQINITSKMHSPEFCELQIEEVSPKALVEWLATLDVHGLKVQSIKAFQSEQGDTIRVPSLILIKANTSL